MLSLRAIGKRRTESSSGPPGQKLSKQLIIFRAELPASILHQVPTRPKSEHGFPKTV